ncbi:elongation factor P 5-aminopentanone reductase [Metabacillus rhizolycopersici]|uniref:SDR family oxidoreductase n=1 Tax=Metabacillus rhizolycopersici TaxID=2875709 RepID=A0ABS7UQC6_9BACI|nr:SDR family oxidoreductase [Metabacillus rhizolycopersici]MBZ5750496.1 SDR family oxidoreductase [Metabacillus rhizolycopersici]
MDKYALITGASGGIGSAIAKKLIEDGYHLYVHYHQNERAMMELIRSISINKNIVIPIQANLTKQSGVQYLIDQIQMPIDLLILNSGMSFYGLVTDMSDDDIDQMVNIHITSPFRLTQKLIPMMIRKRAGNIIVISSIWGITGASCEVLYSMVKGGQNSFVKALAKELAPSQIRVNAIAPGAIQTRMLSNFSTEELTELEEEIPLGRLGQPDEIANTVSFLASKQASYITGQVISVNGGWC